MARYMCGNCGNIFEDKKLRDNHICTTSSEIEKNQKVVRDFLAMGKLDTSDERLIRLARYFSNPAKAIEYAVAMTVKIDLLEKQIFDSRKVIHFYSSPENWFDGGTVKDCDLYETEDGEIKGGDYALDYVAKHMKSAKDEVDD